jgi:DNA-binding response OmpR family regulator
VEYGELGPVSNKSILVVEEYQPLLNTLLPILAGFGYQILTARSLNEALPLAQQRTVDAVLLDFRLCPSCPSDCFAEKVRITSPNSKFLIWCTDDKCIVNQPPCAAATFMKPMSPDELAVQLDAVLGQ